MPPAKAFSGADELDDFVATVDDVADVRATPEIEPVLVLSGVYPDGADSVTV